MTKIECYFISGGPLTGAQTTFGDECRLTTVFQT